MKISILLLLLTCSAMADFRIGDTPARTIAKSHLPGKGDPGACLIFAEALNAKFSSLGIPSRIIILNHKHALVVYQDGSRLYMMDNLAWQPVWVNRSLSMAVTEAYGPLINIESISVYGQSHR